MDERSLDVLHPQQQKGRTPQEPEAPDRRPHFPLARSGRGTTEIKSRPRLEGPGAPRRGQEKFNQRD